MKRIFFHDNLNAWMRINNVTSQDLAKAIGCDVRSINRHRRGDRFPRLDDMIKYKDMMGVSLDRMILDDAAFDEHTAS